jgi:tetratricopeptide (TPR) repeat protein
MTKTTQSMTTTPHTAMQNNQTASLSLTSSSSRRAAKPAGAPVPLRIFSFLAGAALALSVCSAIGAPEPFYEGLGKHRMDITSDSPKAQRYFNQGMAFLYGFNHGAAIRSFKEAARLDPECAMAHWGIALASGPHINFPLVPPPAAELAWKELELARKHAAAATPVEQKLIEALGARYANPQPEDRSPLDVAYADAMRKVWQEFPNDADVGVLFAEAMMNLRPWDQWTPEGEEQPGTAEILATLDAVLNPLANHLYIHAVEASPHPERADAAAARLLTLQPGLAHNVHMPSHIDVRRGRWQAAVESNLKAVEADRRYRKVAGPPKGFLNVYTAHNRHMLAYAAMMSGQSQLALKHIRAMAKELPEEFLKEFALAVEGFAVMPMEVMIRFGKWDAILAEPDNYPDHMPFCRALHSAARAIAWAAKGNPAEARKDQAIFVERVKLVPKEATFGNNSAEAILAVAAQMVEGEILIREEKWDEGLAALRAAVKSEDALKYDEPPGWIVPVRHALGASLMKAGRFTEAEQVYRDDLARLPENGWSLFGLAQSLRAQAKDEAAAIEARFKKVWARADLEIPSSCMCQVLNSGK